MLVFDHNQNLNYIRVANQDLEIIETTKMPDLITVGGGQNHLTLLTIDERAFVFLSGILVKIYDLEGGVKRGDVSLVTDIYNQTTVVGAQTRFAGLLINSAGLIGRTDSGLMTRPAPGEIAVGDMSLLTSAGYARVTLLSPLAAFSGDYSFGFLFRNEATGIDNWLSFDDNKQWQHVRRSTSGAESVMASGTAPDLNTREAGENLLEFLSTSEQHQIYLNGTLLLNIAILGEDLPFSIAPMAGFKPEHNVGNPGTVYRDFSAWSVAQ